MIYENPEVKYLGPPDFDIVKEDGVIHAEPVVARKAWRIIVDNVEGKSKAFKRNAVQQGGKAQRWLVAEFKGVRFYAMDDGTFILTDRELYPTEGLLKKLQTGEYHGEHC